MQTDQTEPVDQLEKINECEEQIPLKLCGYLNKLTVRGPLKSCKSRWFVFSENTCKLFYYATADDVDPQGEIDVACATFTFEVTNLERPGLFFISTPDKKYELEAPDRHIALFWLQELQKRRKNFCRQRSTQSQLRRNRVQSVGRNCGGLLQHDDNCIIESSSEDVAMSALMEPVVCPIGAIGEEAIKGGKRPSRTWSFNFKESGDFKTQKNNKKSVSQDRSLSSSNSALSLSPEVTSPKPKKASFRLKFPRNKTKKSDLSDGSNVNVLTPVKSDGCLEDELKATQEVNEVLRTQVDCLSRQRDTLQKELDQTHTEQELMNQKDAEIAELVSTVKSKDEELQKARSDLQYSQSQLQDLMDQIEMYAKAMKEKDEVLIKLSDHCDQMEDGNKMNVTDNSFAEDELTHLKDSVQAYQSQNKFLNKEILELNQLRQEAIDQQEQLLIQCSEWEAKFYQIRSKHLLLLKNLHAPRGRDAEREIRDLVSDLVSDALAEQNPLNHNNVRQVLRKESIYDEFGFARAREEESLASAASNCHRISEGIKLCMKEQDEKVCQAQHSRWETLMLHLGDKELQRSDEMKGLIRAGIPLEYRNKIWSKCINWWVKSMKQKLGVDYYQTLLATNNDVLRSDPAAKQIELDLLRTLPNNKHYETLHSDGIPCLRRILLAYSWHNREDGYCQGLNRLAAIARLILTEEDAFWCLVAIAERIMPSGYYSRTLIGSQADQRVLKELVSEKLPRLYGHFENCKVDLTLFTFNWFLCVFVDNVPMTVFLRVWDTFLYEGSKVLFRFSLAFFKMYENDLLQENDVMSINRCFRKCAENLVDVNRITHIAFNEINPFSKRVIRSKRVHHTQAVKAELEEVEKLRHSYFNSRGGASRDDSLCSDDGVID